MRIKRPFLVFIFVLTLFSFLLRGYRITEPKKYYFDEVYHAVTAKAYADNNPAAYNPYAPPPKEGTAYDWLHPPLAKLIQAGSIKLFGDKPFGWRLPSLLFGTAIIPAVFLLAYILFGAWVAVFASLVIAFENLTFVMTRITMNDVFITFFSILSVIFTSLYLKSGGKFKYTILTAISLGLALASKWPGVYAILGCFLIIVAFQIKNKKLNFGPMLILLIPILIYLGAYGQFFLQGHSFIYPADIKAFFGNVILGQKNPYMGDFAKLHQQIWAYQNTRNLKHSYATTPLYCTPEGLDGPKTWCPWILDVRGIYFSYEQYGSNQAGYIYAIGNPFVFWFGIVGISYLIGKFVEERKLSQIMILLLYFIFWVPWIFSPRVMFLYHYLPSLPFLAIATGVGLADIYRSKFKYLAFAIVGVFLISFFYFYPITSGYPIPIQSIDNFMMLSTWR